MVQAGDGKEQIHENNEHEKLHHIGVYHAEQTRGGGIENEDDGGDEGAHLIADAHLASQQLDDGSGGGDLRGHSAHHGKGHHGRENAFGHGTEPIGEQAGDRFDVVLFAHPLDTSGIARENEHAQHVGNGGGNGLEAGGVSDAGPAHHGAAADDGGADSCRQHHGP